MLHAKIKEVIVLLKIALGQLEVVPGRPDLNTAAMLSMIEKAKTDQADIIIFPELAIPGYLLGDTWEQNAFLQDCEEYGKKVIAATQNICVIFGNVAIDWDKRGDDGRVRKYNACFVAQNGQLCQGNFPYPYRIKTLLPNYREFDDARHFYSLRKLSLERQTNLDELIQPVEVNIRGKKISIGCLICEDGWGEDYAQKPISIFSTNKTVDLFVNISSSPFTAGKNDKRNRVFSKQAKDTGIPLIYVNNVGMQNNGKTIYTFDGSSAVYSSEGDIILYCQPFECGLFYIDLALEAPSLPALTIPSDGDIQHIYTALYYGIKKFMAAIGMQKVVIGVSGGIDSAVAAALYARVLPPENILLVNMPSIYNSATTKNLAALLAANLGCLYTVMPIQQAVDLTEQQLQNTPILAANGTSSNLTLAQLTKENIQARDRSSRILAGLAAAFGGGFTCNANKSEMTVGYSTLYGDQAGFLACLADLWKHQVYQLASYLNKEVYGKEVIPQQTIDIVPSAELSFDQAVDEGKGDPIRYEYHDYLYAAFMERWNRATPEDILLWYENGKLEEQLGCEPGLIAKLFPTTEQFIADLERWWRLYTGMAVAKRIQAPPVLAISRRAYGFDHREAQNGTYYTANYHIVKQRLIQSKNDR